MMCRIGGPYLPARLALLPAVRCHVIHLTQSPGDFAQTSNNRVENPNGCPVDSAEDGELGSEQSQDCPLALAVEQF